MNLLSLAEKLAGETSTPATFDAERCLHSRDKRSECMTCVAVCPVEAITPGKEGGAPHFDAMACQRCLACLPVCPTGAFSMEDEVPKLLRCLSAVCRAHPEVDTLELVCRQHPSPALGLTGRAAAIQVRGCLAGLGMAAYLHLATRPIKRVVVRTDGCKACSWQLLSEQVQDQVAAAQVWLKRWGRDDFVEVRSELEDPVRRPVHHADAPPFSRRDLFRGRVLEEAPVEMTSSQKPFHQRLRLLSALPQLGDAVADSAVGDWPQAAGHFATLSVDERCSACGTCARVCPGGALILERDNNAAFALTFATQTCLACDACAHVCPEGAITVNHGVTVEQLLCRPVDVTLVASELAKCKRCNGHFAARSLEDGLCSVCAFRRKNPFGYRLVGRET